MTSFRLVALLVGLCLGTAYAEPAERSPQLQIDGGLSVIGPAYEHPLPANLAVAFETFVFGTYFLPWFDAGDDVKGLGIGVRPTWFARETRRGLYVTPYFRAVSIDETSLFGFDGIGFSTGAFVGWAFGLGEKLDLRLGAGAQYIHFHVETDTGERSTGTPFVAIDATLGYRLSQ